MIQTPNKTNLTMFAVMKKFHGNRVPSPRVKKISHTPLYLSGQRSKQETGS